MQHDKVTVTPDVVDGRLVLRFGAPVTSVSLSPAQWDDLRMAIAEMLADCAAERVRFAGDGGAITLVLPHS